MKRNQDYHLCRSLGLVHVPRPSNVWAVNWVYLVFYQIPKYHYETRPPMADWCNTFLVLICQRAHSKPSTHFLTNAFLIQAAPSFTDPSALYFVKLMLTVFLLATSLYLSNLRPSYFFAQSAVVFHYGFHSRICRIFDKWIPDRLFIAMMTRGRDEVISGLCDKLRKRRKRNQSLDFYHLTLSTLIQINDIHPTHFFGQRI